MFKHILVATDGSELSKKAVDTAISMASLHQAKLCVLTVVPEYPLGYFEGVSAKVPEDIARVEKAWADNAHRLLGDISAEAARNQVEVETVVANSGSVSDAILAAARKRSCDLIVMASHGHRGLSRLLLGSETQHVLTRTELPVLVLR